MHCSTSKEKNNNRISYFRTFACIGIVLLHTTFTARMLYGNVISEDQVLISDIICNMLMWCVPGFIMVTGILLLDSKRQVTIGKAIKKYAWRIIKALILFQITYELIELALGSRHSENNVVYDIGMNIITAGGTSLLWYLYMLIGLYLMMPFFKKIIDGSSARELNVLALICLAFLSVMPLFGIFGINIGFYIPVYTVYPCYLFLGYMIYHKVFLINRKIGFGLLVLNSCIIIGFTVLAAKGVLPYDLSGLWGYSSIFVVLQSIGMCELFVDGKSELPGILNKAVLELDKCSFGIYLIHIIFVKLVLKNYGFNPFENGGILAIVAIVICITIASYIITKALKLLPVIRNIL